MPVPTSSFQFDYYLVDYLARLSALLEQQGVVLNDDMRSFMEEARTALDTRDTDLEDFLGLGSFAPACGVSLSGTQSINHNSPTAITFTTQDFLSTDVIEWDGSNTITVQADGIVTVMGNLRFQSNAAAAGVRLATINQGLIEITGAIDSQAVNNVQARLPVCDTVACLAGDTFQLIAYQTQGVAQNVDIAKLRAVYIGQTG